MGSIFQITPGTSNFHNPTPGEITLMAGYPNANDGVLSEKLCKCIRDCGLNAVGTTISKSSILESLENCNSFNLKLFINNWELTDSAYVQNFVEEFKNVPALGGWLLSLHILPDLLDNVIKRYQFQLLINKIRMAESGNTKSDGHPIFMGLEGDWKKDSNYHDIESYPEYIKNVAQFLKPSFWVYSYFPALTNSSSSTIIPEERQLTFYKNLQYYSLIARYTASPFWIYCRSMATYNQYGWYGGIPSAKIIRGIVFSALAYGAQGIYYWNFRQFNSDSYSDAPLNYNGEKNTKTWNILQSINQEIKAFNTVFCGCEHLEAVHITSLPNEPGIKKMRYPIGPLIKISSQTLQEPELLISHINNAGRDYLVIVANPFKEVNNLVKLEFSEYWKIYKIEKDGETCKSTELNNTIVNVSFNTAQYLIFNWE